MKILKMLKKFSVQILIIIFLILCFFIYRWYVYDFPYTRDAYLYANSVNVASLVSGDIEAIYVKNNQAVKKGALLFSLEQTPFINRLKQAKAALLDAQKKYAKLQLLVNVAKDNVKQQQTDLATLQDHLNRYTKLAAANAVPQITLVDNRTLVNTKKIAVDLARQQLQVAEADANNSDVKKAQAVFAQAQYNLRHSKIYAQADGYVTNFNLRVGDYVSAGQGLFALIDTQKWWLIGRFKETLLDLIHPGQKVKIHVDMYPGQTFYGVVESMGWWINRKQASPNAAKSTLTYLQPTENWVNISQRFPVYIHIFSKKNYPFRIGASASARIES